MEWAELVGFVAGDDKGNKSRSPPLHFSLALTGRWAILGEVNAYGVVVGVGLLVPFPPL